MSDEQVEVLRQILDMQKQTLAFAKSQRDEVMAIQHLALERQNKALRIVRVLVAIMALAIVGMIASAVLR